MKSLVLAEKPSVGKELARVLNCKKGRHGYIEGDKYVVTWSLGHLVTLANPEDYSAEWKQWRMETLPMMPEKMKLQVIRNSRKQFNTVKDLMKRDDIGEMIIATDAGREGELVARWIMWLGAWGKRPFKRLWISSQTDEAILEGFENLKNGNAYNHLYDAAQSRAEADWLVGINVTRALTCKFDLSLSAGRVQTPTLALMTRREDDIENFTPVDFWGIRADFGDYFGAWMDKKGSRRIFQRERAEEISSKIQGQTGVIESVETKLKSEQPPLAYDLTELQRDANKQYGFSAKHTLSVLQKLYEMHKLVTYPRTDSRYITSDMVATLPRRLKAVSVGNYTNLIKPLLEKDISPGKRFVNDAKVSDHHAIIPTEITPILNNLTSDERAIYDLIVKRFITVLYPAYKYYHTVIITKVCGEKFYASGKMEKALGWKAITSLLMDDDLEDEDEDQLLKKLEKGEKKEVQGVQIKQSHTKPPSRYTEATLLTAMESPGKFIEDEDLRDSIKDRGLGTPATRADIIEKLLKNHYIERHGKSLHPTPLGRELIELVPPELKEPELTAEWEQRLAKISKGEERRIAFMKDICQNAIELVQSVKNSTAKYDPKHTAKEVCPVCGKPMMEITGKKGKKSLVCTDKRCGFEEGQEVDKRRGSKRQNQRLIKQYSQKSKGTSLGDLLKSAMDKKE